MEKTIEVRYAGAVVGRSATVRELDAQGLFLGVTEPMPVGTVITLRIGDQSAEGKVAAVAESQDLARAGMRVHLVDPAAAAALFGMPASAPVDPVVPPVAEKAPEPAAVVSSGPITASEPVAGGDGGKKNRRNKRR